MKEYDLIVIGAGPGGYEAAFEAADRGMKTALVEKDALGGTCLNRGCIPTKALLHAAGLYTMAAGASAFGIDVGEVKADPVRMQQRKNDVVQQLRAGIEATAKRKKVDIYRGLGTVTGEGNVAVSGETTEDLHAAHVLLATGSRPARIPLPGSDLPGVITSDELLEETGRIGRLLIIGGGGIGVEFAGLYAALGTEVTIVEAMPQLLPAMDRELAQSLKMLLTKRGVSLYTGARVREIKESENGLTCVFDREKRPGKEGGEVETLTKESDKILIAVGRRPCTEGVFAEGCQPAMERGRILVDENGQTSLPGVYAIGDVTGGIMLAHAATAAGLNAVRHMAGVAERIDTRFVPSCVYTEPEIACVGLTLDEAKAAGIAADSRKVPMTANGKTVLTGSERGYIRVVFEKEGGKLLGAQMMCERATDMIGEFTQALSAGLTMADMARVIRPHPTFSEAITDAVRG